MPLVQVDYRWGCSGLLNGDSVVGPHRGLVGDAGDAVDEKLLPMRRSGMEAARLKQSWTSIAALEAKTELPLSNRRAPCHRLFAHGSLIYCFHLMSQEQPQQERSGIFQ